MPVRLYLAVLVLLASTFAHADEPASETPRPIAGFRVEGASKVTDETLGYLLRVEIGDEVTNATVPALKRALVSSELFKSVDVRLEPSPPTESMPDGVIVVANVADKHSWISCRPPTSCRRTGRSVSASPRTTCLARTRSSCCTRSSARFNWFFIAAYVVPSFPGSKLSLRLDSYWQTRIYDEYANPRGDPESTALARTSDHVFVNTGVAVGWNHRWWLKSEGRLRGAYVRYDDPHVPGDDSLTLAQPSPDGWDVTVQSKLTMDMREHDHGVTDGAYAQLAVELPVPGLTDYTYASASARAFLSKRLFGEHEVELRTYANIGYHLPFHDEWTLGAASDLRGYPTEQFRGDIRMLARLEYSVPLLRWNMLSFRALGFFDSGVIGFQFTDPSVRDYLPDQVGRNVFRNDAGGGLRIYVSNIVLPLLGLDIGYGFESSVPDAVLPGRSDGLLARADEVPGVAGRVVDDLQADVAVVGLGDEQERNAVRIIRDPDREVSRCGALVERTVAHEPRGLRDELHRRQLPELGDDRRTPGERHLGAPHVAAANDIDRVRVAVRSVPRALRHEERDQIDRLGRLIQRLDLDHLATVGLRRHDRELALGELVEPRLVRLDLLVLPPGGLADAEYDRFPRLGIEPGRELCLDRLHDRGDTDRLGARLDDDHLPIIEHPRLADLDREPRERHVVGEHAIRHLLAGNEKRRTDGRELRRDRAAFGRGRGRRCRSAAADRDGGGNNERDEVGAGHGSLEASCMKLAIEC